MDEETKEQVSEFSTGRNRVDVQLAIGPAKVRAGPNQPDEGA